MVFWIIAAVVAGLAFIRFSASDPERWHKPPDISENKDFKAGVKRITETGPDGLARLDVIILATPRTQVLAGSPDEGMVTYITRSAVFGFPDYTTVHQVGDTLQIYARLRFGRADTGVNKARVEGWINALQPCRQAAFLHLAPHRHIQRHLALGHEHPPVHMKTDGLPQFNARSGFVGAITINHPPVKAFDVRQCRNRGDQENQDEYLFHNITIAQPRPLTNATRCHTPQPHDPHSAP